MILVVNGVSSLALLAMFDAYNMMDISNDTNLFDQDCFSIVYMRYYLTNFRHLLYIQTLTGVPQNFSPGQDRIGGKSRPKAETGGGVLGV